MSRPRSTSAIHCATLSRKYRSWVTARTAPGYEARNCSSHCTDSASRWLVGSSSSSRSGADSNSWHIATGENVDRRVTRRASQRIHRLVDLRLQVPGTGVVELLLERAHLFEQFIGVLGLHLDQHLVVALHLRVDAAE